MHYVFRIAFRRFVPIGLIFLTACYVHTRARMIEPVIRRPPLCAAAVSFFDDSSQIAKPFLEMARLSVWWPADMIAHVSTVEIAERKKAAKLGANGIIRGRLLGDTIQPRYESGISGIAIFVHEDSAAAIAACDAGNMR